MTQSLFPRRWRLILGSGLLLGGSALSNVAHSQTREVACDCPPAWMPSANGACMNQWFGRQSEKAQLDRFTIYLYEWYRESTLLGPYGSYHIHEIADHLAAVPFPVVIQPSIDASQNALRRQIIVQQLLQAGIGDADRRVVIAFPQAEGLYGEEAARVYGALLGSSRSGMGGGLGGGLSGSSGGGAGGAGIGGISGGGSMIRGN